MAVWIRGLLKRGVNDDENRRVMAVVALARRESRNPKVRHATSVYNIHLERVH